MNYAGTWERLTEAHAQPHAAACRICPAKGSTAARMQRTRQNDRMRCSVRSSKKAAASAPSQSWSAPL